MNRMRVALAQKILPISVIAVLLFCTPLQLSAQERDPRADQVSMVEWFSGLWANLAAWLASEVTTPPAGQGGGGATTQGSCALDPYGCPDHG